MQAGRGRQEGRTQGSESGVRVGDMIAATIRTKPSRTAAVALLDAAALPSSDLTDEHMEHFFFCGSSQAPTAMVGIELCGTSALLRSLVVHPDLRLTGLGKTLVGHAEAHARARGALHVPPHYHGGAVLRAARIRCSFPRQRAGRDPQYPRVRRHQSGELPHSCQATLRFTMKRLHVHVGVDDLDASIRFYSTLFAA